MLVWESIRFISKVNLMSHADFSEKVNGQTKAEADRQTKKLEQRQRHGIPLLASQEGIKLHTNCVRDM